MDARGAVDLAPFAPKSQLRRRSRARWSRWNATIVTLQTAVVISGFAFAAAAYETFYRPLGVSPAEVGLDFPSTVTRSWGTLVAIVLVVGHVITLLFSIKATYLDLRNNVPWTSPHAMSNYALAAIFEIAMLVALFHQAAVARDDVQAGKPVKPISVGPVVFLDVYAMPVVLEQTPECGGRFSPGSSVLLLGTHNGIHFVFDPVSGTTLRISAERCVVSVRP
jgi:hypothetical protein